MEEINGSSSSIFYRQWFPGVGLIRASGLAFSSCLLPMNQFDWLTGAVLLIDEHTFSAAMTNVIQFKQLFNATVIGKPAGGGPNHYSESYRFELPNSKRNLSLLIATILF
ncbi:hypothetical protein CWE13_10360 [Aliidiomarina shirensis]|uniref:Uncharacterized protein n=1 Tax=Aliidiomarina shirensis TaxID=1048642 RepID=A0A432WQ75_9GAMM|nr:hypothetical protein CWE13_10360 [Aliidiomarina shirensis]